MTAGTTRRFRDPARKERILDAAAELVARHGYHAVGMADIGAQAGIVGSGIYRHFDSKAAVLGALLEQVMDTLQRNAVAISARAGTHRHALSSLIRDHIRVATEDRHLLQVYQREQQNLPEDDREVLRTKQRRYIEQWVRVLTPLRGDLDEGEIRLAVHATIGGIQSILFYTSALPERRLFALLDEMTHAGLGVVPHPETVDPRAREPECARPERV